MSAKIDRKYYKYLDNYTIAKLQIICRHKNIPPYGIKKKIILKIIKNLTQEDVKNIIEKNKDKKYIVLCSGKEKQHVYFTEVIFEKDEKKYCYNCKTKCYQSQSNNLFYDESQEEINIREKITQSFYTYLISFTIAKLEIICLYKNIYYTETKGEMINRIVVNATKEEVKGIIDSNKDKKYLVYCRNNKNTEPHQFFTNNKNKKNYMYIHCNQCETKCTQSQYYNEFYDQSFENIIQSEVKQNTNICAQFFHEYLGNFTRDILEIICKYKDIEYSGEKDEIINTMISKITKNEIENIIESNKGKKHLVECSYDNGEEIKWHYFFTNHKNKEEIMGVDCDSCGTECAQIQYINAFYDEEYAKTITQSFHEYLINFTIAKLQLICRYKNICHTGIKGKIIDAIIENTTKEEAENIIETNKDKKYDNLLEL